MTDAEIDGRATHDACGDSRLWFATRVVVRDGSVDLRCDCPRHNALRDAGLDGCNGTFEACRQRNVVDDDCASSAAHAATRRESDLVAAGATGCNDRRVVRTTSCVAVGA